MLNALATAVAGKGSLTESQPILQSIFDGITDGILVIDQNYRVVMFNKAMEKFMGKTADEIEGRFCFFVCHSNNTVCEDCQAQTAFSNISPPSRIKQCFRDNLRRQFEIRNFPIRNGEGKVEFMVEYIKDITERQMMEKELMESRRLAIVGEMAAKTSHEIRNPLQAMEGAAHYLLQEYAEDEKIQKYLGLIKEQISRLNKVTTGMLDDARPKLPHVEKALINAALLKSVAVIEEMARTRGINVELFLDERLPTVTYDAERMQQVFINVLRNAVDAIDGAGTIEIVGAQRQINGEDFLEISFIDSGIGVSQEIADRLFESFYTTKKNGTGLGLPIVKEIMKSHGGYAFIESNPGGGACVRVGLPV